VGVKHYQAGDHPTGYIGLRVTVMVDGDYKQKYLNTRHCAYQDDRCPAFRRLKLEADLQNATWLTESAWSQYQRSVTSNHSTTKPCRGTGVHGLLLSLFLDRRDNWQARFLVNDPEGLTEEVTFFDLGYTDAWHAAVDRWARLNSILAEDVDRVRANMPPPTQFRDLRRQMNSEGYDIPVSALGPVFREGRGELAAARLLKSKIPAKSAKPTPDGDLQEEMAQWFDSQQTTG